MRAFPASPRLNRRAVAAAFALALAACTPAQAAQQDGDAGSALARREPGPATRLPELTLQAQAVSQVAQDTVTITLAAEAQAADQVAVGKKLTALLDETMKQAKQAKGVKARNGAYRLWAVTNRDGKVTGWRGRAEILLESKDFAAASALAGQLSERMPIDGIAFSLSDEARSAEEKRLLVQAANAFRERALAAAQAFGFNGYRIRKIDLGGSGASYAPPQPRAMAAMAAEAKFAADVPLEADTVTVVVTVNGTIYLQ